MKDGEKNCKLYVTNSARVLQIVNKDFLLFRIRSEINPDTIYNVSFSCHSGDCLAVIPTCKYIIELQLNLKKYLSTDFKLFKFIDSQVPLNEPVIIIFNLEDSPILEKNAPVPIDIYNFF